jgi:hypothetical protein
MEVIKMQKFCILLLVTGIWICNNNVKNFIEIAEAPIQDGIRLKIDKPVHLHANEYFSYEHIPIMVTNFSSDTIYFENIFVFKDDHPVWGNFDFCITDQNGNIYSLRPASRHYHKILDRQEEYVMLVPGASFQDKILISLNGFYNLDKGKTYTIFAQYVNQRIYETGFFPTKLTPGKKLWTGVLKSNIYKFRF